MKHKLTDWYPADVKPVRKGVYIRQFFKLGTRLYYSYWDGNFWGTTQNSIKEAYEWRNTETTYPDIPWRGIAK